MGLARDNTHFLADPATEKTFKRGPSIITAMQDAGFLTESTFSTYIADFGVADSFIDFGVPRIDERLPTNGRMEYISLNEDFFWSAHCSGFALEYPTNSWKWGAINGANETMTQEGEVYSIFDTGSSALVFPAPYFTGFLIELFSGIETAEYEVTQGYVLTRCYNEMPSIFFLFGDKWLSV